MLRINLKELIIVDRERESIPLNRPTYSNAEITRRRLFVESFNALFRSLSISHPRVYHLFRRRHIGLPLAHTAQHHWLREHRLRTTDIPLAEFTGIAPHAGINSMIGWMNSRCSEEGVEFMLSGVPFFPGAIIAMREKQNISATEPLWPYTETSIDLVTSLVLNAKKIGIKGWHVYRESELYDLVVKVDGNIGRAAFARLLDPGTRSYFLKVMRPRRWAHAEPRYVIPFGDADTTPTAVVKIAVSPRPATMVALKEEADELEREGAIVPVYFKNHKIHYFTPDALECACEEGIILEITKNNQTIHLTIDAAGEHCDDSTRLVRDRAPALSEVMKAYVDGTPFSRPWARAYPLLSAMIDLANSFTDSHAAHFQAARIAAHHDASEEALAALLVGDRLDQLMHVFHEDQPVESLHSYLHGRYRDLGIEPHAWQQRLDRVSAIARHVRNADRLSIDVLQVDNGDAVHAWLQLVLNQLRTTREGVEQRDVWVAYFSTVAGKLQNTKPGGLTAGAANNIAVVVAPLAERCGFKELAALLRNEIFRISKSKDYAQVLRQITHVSGMDHLDLDRHLHHTTQWIRNICAAAGITEQHYEISHRVKTPYSIWHKMNAFRIDTPALLWDVLAMNIEADNDILVRRIVGLIDQAMPEPTPRFLPHHRRLPAFLKKVKRPSYYDQIIHPRASGFSAVTLFRVTDRGLPIEIQVTNRARHLINVSGDASHWKYKVRSEATQLFGVNITTFNDLADADKTEAVLLHGTVTGMADALTPRKLSLKRVANQRDVNVGVLLGGNSYEQLYLMNYADYLASDDAATIGPIPPLTSGYYRHIDQGVISFLPPLSIAIKLLAK